MSGIQIPLANNYLDVDLTLLFMVLNSATLLFLLYNVRFISYCCYVKLYV